MLLLTFHAHIFLREYAFNGNNNKNNQIIKEIKLPNILFFGKLKTHKIIHLILIVLENNYMYFWSDKFGG